MNERHKYHLVAFDGRHNIWRSHLRIRCRSHLSWEGVPIVEYKLERNIVDDETHQFLVDTAMVDDIGEEVILWELGSYKQYINKGLKRQNEWRTSGSWHNWHHLMKLRKCRIVIRSLWQNESDEQQMTMTGKKIWRYKKHRSNYFIQIRISNWYKKVPSAKTSVHKKWTPPFAQVCGNMYNYVLTKCSHHPKKRIIRFDPYGI